MGITYAEIRAKVQTPYPMILKGKDAELVVNAVNQGIDSHLEACFIAGQDTYEWVGDGLVCKVSAESLPVLLRRLLEDSEKADAEDSDDGMLLVRDILSTLDIETDFPTIVS
jgi:hypothetical protein